MSRFRPFPNAEAEKRAYPNQLSDLSDPAEEEEVRLLGGSGKDDPEAVSIAKPVTRHSNMLGNIIPRGPQPRNTLSRPPFSTGPAVNRKTVPNPRGGIQHALAVEVHKGSNVNSTSNTSERNENLPTPPSAKRQKFDHQASPASSGQTDPLDQISPHAISFHAGQGTSQRPSRAPSASVNSQASGFPAVCMVPMKRNGSSEYRKVEDMMDSKPKTKKQRRNDNLNYLADYNLLPSSPKRSSMSNPIDISGDESQITHTNSKEASQPAYRGTARQPPLTVKETKSNTSRLLKEPTQSPYFNKPRPPTPRERGNVKQKLIAQNPTKKKSPGLAQKFVAADGTRRGSDVNASSDADELQSAPTTVGQNADPDAVFTIRDMRSNSPSKYSSSTLQTTSPQDELAIYVPSTVKSDFPSSNAKSRNGGRPSRPVPPDQEAKPPWSVALAAISLPEDNSKNEDLGLVHDQKLNEYYIQKSGLQIRTTHNSLRIQPQKLNKIIWEQTGVRVRLESSRIGTDDNVLDLELVSERDVQDLLNRLQNSKPLSVLKVISKNSAHMQKIFQKRLSELRTLESGTKSYRPEKVEIVTHSRERHDRSKYPAPSNTDTASRQQSKSSIVNRLVHNATHDTEMAAGRPETRMPPMPNGLPEESGIKGILAKLKPAHNEHLNLRRSTRNSDVHDGESLLSSLDGIPDKEKYSVKHGLGDPWKRPLTYPKVGKKKTTVEWSDLERLDEGEFLNDNLISFYLRYLEQRLEEERPELAKRVYFFNTFFFATLTNTHKGRKRFNYEGVQKWTRSVDLFTKDYIIVPINEQAHWYLAVICNLPALDRDMSTPEDEATSPIEDGRAVSKQRPGQTEERASSPTNQPRGNESERLIVSAKEPNERETRNSFSQMSLENDARLPAGDELGLYDTEGPEKPRPTSEDKEMLDSQIEGTMPAFTISKEVGDHPAPSGKRDDEVEDPIEDQDESPKAAAKSRKSKRKSLPAPITKLDPKKPAIITFDSLGQTRGQTIRILKDYLREEAKAKRGMEFEESQMKGINAKRIPQQDNFSDCGVFLLGYVDTFLRLETDPKDFITKTIQQTHEEKDWSKLVPGDLRASIRKQVRELHAIQTNERREESAKKSGKITEKKDKGLASSPSRPPDQAKNVHNQHGKAIDPERVPATTSKPPNPSLLDIPRTRNEALETARPCEEDIDKKDDMLEELLQTSERAMQKSAEYQRLYNSDDAELGVYDDGAPAVQRDDPSVIMVDGQSQQRLSAPTGVTYPSFSSGKQSYPESTSSRVVNPIPLSFEEERSLELPSEIPDSQNSNGSRKTAKILNKPAPTAPAANPDPASVSANSTVISDSTQGLPDPQDEPNERFERRKTGRKDQGDIQEAPEKEDMVFMVEEPSERREERKARSKRRKKFVGGASKDFEEVQVHVIDD